MKVLAIILSCFWLFASSERYLHWHERDTLSWADFSGAADPASPMAAYTYSNMHIVWACEDGQFSLLAETRFDKERSWQKGNGSTALLAHEQLHFDITELYARKLRQHFAAMPDPCAMAEADIRADIQSLVDGWHDEQLRYDSETDHSLDRDGQAVWDKRIRLSLNALARYAQP